MTSFEKIDSHRIEKGWSGAELTRKLGLSRGVYTQWKQGLQKPSPENLKKMAELFGTSVSNLLDDREKEIPITNSDEDNEKRKQINNYLDQCSLDDQDLVLNFLRRLMQNQ